MQLYKIAAESMETFIASIIEQAMNAILSVAENVEISVAVMNVTDLNYSDTGLYINALISLFLMLNKYDIRSVQYPYVRICKMVCLAKCNGLFI